MAQFISWFNSNWSSVIGAVGIIGSLWFTAASFRADAKQKEITNLLALDERHRTLWSEVKQRPELKRILSENVDLVVQPLTPEEDVSMWQIAQQFETGWRVEILGPRCGRFFQTSPSPRGLGEHEKVPK